MPRILFVSGFHPQTRARDLAYEFERYGPLVRCDVPAPRGYGSSASRYAFVEFRETPDAEAAYHEMHGRDFEGSRLSVQWARNPPSAVWRLDRGPSSGDRERSPRGDDRRRDRGDRDRDRERSPRGGDRGRGDRERERDRSPRGSERGRGDRDRERDGGARERERRQSRSRSRSPRRSERRRSRSHTPVQRKRTPSPTAETGDVSMDDRARTPPREPPSVTATPPRD